MRLHGDAQAERLQPTDHPTLEVVDVALVMVVVVEVMVCGSILQEMVGNEEHSVGEGQAGLLLPPAAGNPVILRPEFPGRSAHDPGGLHEGRRQSGTAVPGAPGPAFPGGFVVSGAERSPRRTFVVGGELDHVEAELGDHHIRRPSVDPGQGTQPGGVRLIGDHQVGKLGIQACDGPVEVLLMGELLSREGALKGSNPPRQGGHERGLFLRSFPLASTAASQHPSPMHQGSQHRPSRDPQDVHGDGAQLQVGRLQQLLHAVGLIRPRADQLLPVAELFTQRPDGGRGDEALPERAVLEELRDPLGIAQIALQARECLDLPAVDDKHVGHLAF